MLKRIVLVIIATVAVAAGYLIRSQAVGQQGSRDEELVYLRAVLPDELLQYSNLDVASREAVVVGGEGAERHLALRLFPGQKRVHGGIRAEVSVDFPFRPGDRVRYEWRLRIPDGFVTDAPANRWWVIGQWHDQPDPRRGETWDQFPSRSPPVVLGLGELDGRLAFAFGYGLTTDGRRHEELGPLWVERGRWHHVAVVIHWSQGPDGSAEVFLDHAPQPSLSAHGPNMNNGYQHYWKLGQYRHPDINTDNRIDIADLRVGPAPQLDAEPAAAADGAVQ